MGQRRNCIPRKIQKGCAAPSLMPSGLTSFAKWRMAEGTWDMVQFALRSWQGPAVVCHDYPAQHGALRELSGPRVHGPDPCPHAR